MIKEQYVSIETAELLKEKDFPQNPYICNTAYTTRKKLSNNAKSFVHNFELFNSCHIKPRTYSMAPTQQMAMQWLRDIHNWHIDIFIGNDYSDDADGHIVHEWSFWSFSIHGMPSGNIVYNNLDQIDYIEYQSYEDACEAALQYCLKNLL